MVLLEKEDLRAPLDLLAQQETLDRQAIRAFREIPVLLGTMVPLDLRVLLALLGILAQRVHLDLLVHLERQVTQELQETGVQLDHQEIRDRLVILDLLVQLAILEIEALLVLPGLQGNQA